MRSLGILVALLLGFQSAGAFSAASIVGASSRAGSISPRFDASYMSAKASPGGGWQEELLPVYEDDTSPMQSLDRRRALQAVASMSLTATLIRPTIASGGDRPLPQGKVFEIADPDTYSAVAYIPPVKKDGKALPLLVVLHGAGNNEQSALHEFTQGPTSSGPPGDHANLPPYLLSTNQAPSSLSENFVVVAPYAGKGKRSLYDEPRGKTLSFLKWFNGWIEMQALENGSSVAIDRSRVSLFGFSEGATLAVELATTRQFSGVVVCSYGFTGVLPKMAVERLQGIPMWIFHSKADDIYPIDCSNRLVDNLITYEGGMDVFGTRDIVKYTKLIPSQDGAGGGNGREHVRAALVASKSGEVFSWLLSQK